jgi:hypothetical protein
MDLRRDITIGFITPSGRQATSLCEVVAQTNINSET